MSSKPWIAWYPADYRAKTSHLTFEQSEAYRRLLEAYYENRGGLTNDRPSLYRICRAMTDAEKAAVDSTANEFFSKKNGHLVNFRADEELAIRERHHARLSAAGHRGGLIGGKGRPKQDHNHISQPQSQPQELLVGLGLEEERKKKNRKKKKERMPFVLPDWIPQAQWDAWIEARTKRRNAPTEWAKSLALAKLESLRQQGHHPAAVLAQSAFRGWAGLFPVKEDGS